MFNRGVGDKDAVQAIYKRTVRKQMFTKLACLFVLAMLALLTLGVLYFWRITGNYEDYAVKVMNNYTYESTDLEAPRGLITDRNGTIMAYSETYYLLILEPKNILDEDYYQTTLYALNKVLDIDEDRLVSVLNGEDESGKPMKDKQYYRYRMEDGVTLYKVTEEQAAEFKTIQAAVNVSRRNDKAKAIKELYELDDDGWKKYKEENPEYTSYQIKGVRFEKQFKRIYPYNNLAAKVIGYYTGDTSTGIENYYSSYLTGVPGKSYSYLDDDYNVTTEIVDEVMGNTVVSTIDMNVQQIVEDVITGYMQEWGAKNVAAMVMNPNNGEIIAMADDKRIDLNNPVTLPEGFTPESWSKLSDEEKSKYQEEMYGAQRLYCTTSPYEPGSIFKPITIASALEQDAISTGDEFDCYGMLYVRGVKIRCHNRGGCGHLNLMGALDNSCNVSLMQIVAKLGAADFDMYFKRFGFGKKTGIDLPGEEPGIIFKDYTKETELELATSSFGQGFAATMIQMSAAFSSLVNGGYYYTPHVMKEIVTTDGKMVESYDTTAKFSTISSLTSEYMKQALFSVVENGTGGFCKIQGYDIGGKTGTAEQSPRGTDLWVASFVSAAPIEKPQLLVYVVVDRTNDYEWHDSSKPAQDLSKQIWSKLLPYYNVHSNFTEYDYLMPFESASPIIDKNNGSYRDDVETTTTEEDTEETDETGESDETEETGESEATTEESSPDESIESEAPPEEIPTETPAPEETEVIVPEETLPSEPIPAETESIAEPLPPEEIASSDVMLDGPTEAETDPDTGYPFDPITGMPRDPETGWLVDKERGLLFDPVKGLFIDPVVYVYIDPEKGLFIDAERGLYIDPVTWMYIDPDTGMYVDPDTRLPLEGV